MSVEKAIDLNLHLLELLKIRNKYDIEGSIYSDANIEALDMAIRALKEKVVIK